MIMITYVQVIKDKLPVVDTNKDFWRFVPTTIGIFGIKYCNKKHVI